jgi:hypothetical protein
MEYTLTISQKAIAENFPELDIKDAALIDFLGRFVHGGNIKKRIIGDTVFYWFDYGKIMSENPLLKLGEEAIRKRMRALCQCKILKSHPENSGGLTFFAFGEEFQWTHKHRENNPDPSVRKSRPPRYENPDISNIPLDQKSIGENANNYTFENFWNDYDYKVGSKIKAKKAFEKLKPLEREQIRETLDMYKADTSTVETTGKDFKRMRKHPEFYLSGKMWEAYAERLAAQKAENETFAPEWTDEYEKYIEWVKKCYPKSLKAAKYLSKQQYVRYKTTYYVEGKSFIDEKREREFLIQAHDDVENNDDLRARVTDIFSYHCELIKERLKMYQI